MYTIHITHGPYDMGNMFLSCVLKPYQIPEEENDILHAAKNTDENLYIHLLPYTNRSSVGKLPF